MTSCVSIPTCFVFFFPEGNQSTAAATYLVIRKLCGETNHIYKTFLNHPHVGKMFPVHGFHFLLFALLGLFLIFD
jgi:hypothetical protein